MPGSGIDLSRFGGKPIFEARGGNGSAQDHVGWDFGWIPPERRTVEEEAADLTARADFPRFHIQGNFRAVGKACLWEAVLAQSGGKHWPAFYQKTGSCVGNGGGGAIGYTQAVEVWKGDQEEVIFPYFWLLPYGRSRYYAGMRGRGEGSFGSAFARAAKEDGICRADLPGLPRWADEGGVSWGADQELRWSDGARVPEEFSSHAKNYRIVTTAVCPDADAVRDAIVNGYAVTIASNWGGMEKPPVQGDPPVLLNRRVTRWSHQMCVIGYWDHPTLGEIFYILNSWGVKLHGTPPDNSPPGGFWTKKSEMDWICRDSREAIAFSGVPGYPANTDWLPWVY